MSIAGAVLTEHHGQRAGSGQFAYRVRNIADHNPLPIDLVDRAIRSAASANPTSTALVATRFVPFDPATKMAEATVRDRDGETRRVVKGAFATVSHIVQLPATASLTAEMLERQGYRVLAVAAGPAGAMRLAGLIALSDPPQADSAALIGELRDLGVRTVMVTGDAPATAATVARMVGIEGEVFTSVPIPDDIRPEQFAVFAGVLPEDKYRLVKALQKGGHTIGMCGDGALGACYSDTHVLMRINATRRYSQQNHQKQKSPQPTMQIEPQIRFRGMEPSPPVEAIVRERIARLDRFHDRLSLLQEDAAAPHHAETESSARNRQQFWMRPASL